eukprot:TRINITY_DN4103_c0_g1_i1.p2 TRINITY_DN4103_c0_g1~~TRINITY_DN4103_c0_g1_i1.p2  ORF type:complete len:101 (+),score=7.88 TRINITY_DN4103_c0_g1_i1:2-304(+)
MAVHHVVLFKVRSDAAPSDVDDMMSSINDLASLPFVNAILLAPAESELYPGYTARNNGWTHMLLSTFDSPAELQRYAIVSHRLYMSSVDAYAQRASWDTL